MRACRWRWLCVEVDSAAVCAPLCNVASKALSLRCPCRCANSGAVPVRLAAARNSGAPHAHAKRTGEPGSALADAATSHCHAACAGLFALAVALAVLDVSVLNAAPAKLLHPRRKAVCFSVNDAPA